MKNWRTIFIWDVHWCFDEFELLIEKLKIEDNDMIYLVWDMINKWPKSWKVIKFLYKNQNQYKAVLWNHELGFLSTLENKNHKYKNEIYTKLSDKFIKHPKICNYFVNLPLYIEEKDFIVLHWGLDPQKSIKDHTKDEITNIREVNNKPWYDQYTWDKKIIYWHWALNWLNIRGKTIWLDTWCAYWWALTAYILETWDIYSQPALDIYQNIFEKIKKSCTYTN